MRGARSVGEVLGLWRGEINRDSPQAEGLLNWWTGARTSPAGSFDLASGRMASVLGATSGATRVGPTIDGMGVFGTDANEDAISEEIPDTNYIGKPLTLVWTGVVNDDSGATVFLGKHTGSGGASGNPFDFRTGPSFPTLIRTNGSGLTAWFAFSAIPIGTLFQIAVQAPADIDVAPGFFLDARPLTSIFDGGAGSGPSNGTNAPLRLLRRDDGGGQIVGYMVDARIYSGFLSAARLAEIRWDRFDLHGIATPRRFAPPSGATTHDADWTEGAVAGDAEAQRADLVASATEGAVAGDAETGATTAQRSTSEGVLAGDLDAGATTSQRSTTEGAVVGDTQAGGVVSQHSTSEGVVLGDAEDGDVISLIAAELSEGVVAGDAEARLYTGAGALAEGAKAGDSEAVRGDLVASVSEGAKLGDVEAAVALFGIAITEGANAGDVELAGTRTVLVTAEGAVVGELFVEGIPETIVLLGVIRAEELVTLAAEELVTLEAVEV